MVITQYMMSAEGGNNMENENDYAKIAKDLKESLTNIIASIFPLNDEIVCDEQMFKTGIADLGRTIKWVDGLAKTQAELNANLATTVKHDPTKLEFDRTIVEFCRSLANRQIGAEKREQAKMIVDGILEYYEGEIQ
jgi:hypothetical protein